MYLKHLSVKRRQFVDTEHPLLSGAAKQGHSFSPHCAFILQTAMLLPDVVKCYCSLGREINTSTDLGGPLGTEKNPVFSHSTAGTGIICHTGCLYLETWSCKPLQTKKKKKSIYFIQAKILLPQIYDYSLA